MPTMKKQNILDSESDQESDNEESSDNLSETHRGGSPSHISKSVKRKAQKNFLLNNATITNDLMTIPVNKLNAYNISEVYTGVQLPVDHHAVCWEDNRFVSYHTSKRGKKYINLIKGDDKPLMSIQVPKD
tara:strand:+ start:448 stop:837 length:390 start_codon:yes stop_codon:yes gene_type:complete